MHERGTVLFRIRLLLVVHLIVGIAPVGMFLIQYSNWMFPWMWALSALSIAQLMLLSFWAGMATTKGAIRLLGALCGTAYVTTWYEVAPLLSPNYSGLEQSFATSFLVEFSSDIAVVLLFAGAFMLIRRSGTKLRRLSLSESHATPARVQYSILNLLVILSISSVVFGLTRSARTAETSTAGFVDWQSLAGIGLMLIVFLVNVVCAAWAALSPGGIRLRIVLVLFVAVLLGIAFSVASGNDSGSWWIFVCASLIPVLSTAIVILTLLVVRSCGYRLLPKDFPSPDFSS